MPAGRGQRQTTGVDNGKLFGILEIKIWIHWSMLSKVALVFARPFKVGRQVLPVVPDIVLDYSIMYTLPHFQARIHPYGQGGYAHNLLISD